MTKDYLTVIIDYTVNGPFKISGDCNDTGKIEVLETFLRNQIGAGPDPRKPDYKETYQISLQWHPSNDKIVASCNTGNYGLRDGILQDVLRKTLRET